jgi:hypothetical protein
MRLGTLFLSAFICVLSNVYSYADSTTVNITAQEILAKADSVTHIQDSLFKSVKYRVREEFIFSELRDKGEIKNSDTVISMVTRVGSEEISREVLYTTKKSDEAKKEKSQSTGFQFSYTDTTYNFSLTETTDSSYVIATSPKGDPPKGAARGVIIIDRQMFFTRNLNLEVPKPEGALKEFSTELEFEPLEGGLVVLKEMKMRGFAKAFLGIFKVRFTGDLRYSDYEILQQ